MASMAMITDRGLLSLTTWLSPAFPVGGFSYSHGLETAVEEGIVTNRDGLIDWLGAILRHGPARNDAIVFGAIHRAVLAGDEAAFLAAAARAAAMRGTRELALEASAQGAAFLATLDAAFADRARARWAALLEGPSIAPGHAVAAALAFACAGIKCRAALLAYLQAFAANIVSAGVRLIPLGQSDGQRAIAALGPVILGLLDAVEGADLAELGTATPMIDLMSMRHETQYTRLFRS